jgi:hypothetical protein
MAGRTLIHMSRFPTSISAGARPAGAAASRVGSRPEPYLDQLAHLIADQGIQAFESDIARLVVRLRAAGHHGPIVAALSDRHAADVVRERAFGQLLCLLLDGVDRPATVPDGFRTEAA